MAGSLPPEILNVIVHEVDDTASLRRCSLVSTTFLYPSQQCLFHSLHLHPDDIQPAHTLFQGSPHLAIYVRDVKLDLEESWTQNLDYALVPSLLGMLSNIESLRVRGTSANFSLANVPPLTSALCHALALPSLERFELADISDVPPSLLLTAVSSVTHLKIVELSSRVPNAIDEHEETCTVREGTLHTPRLEELALTGSDHRYLSRIVDMITHPGYLDVLRNLKMALHSGSQIQFHRVIHAVFRTLERLEIKCGGAHRPPPAHYVLITDIYA
jgi:hypothetical protein